MQEWLLFSCDVWVAKLPVAWGSSLVGVGCQHLVVLGGLLLVVVSRLLSSFVMGVFSSCGIVQGPSRVVVECSS